MRAVMDRAIRQAYRWRESIWGTMGTFKGFSSAFRKGARPNIGAGWVCMPFKPVRLNPIRISGQLVRSSSVEYDFIVDEATAYSDTNGARGSMEIPVPPSATGVSGFRTDAQVIMRLFRVGWNRRENKGDNRQLLEETIEQGTFHKEMAVHSELDESHALAVSVRAQGKSEIWPVAVRFD